MHGLAGLPGDVLPARKMGRPLGSPRRIWMSRWPNLSNEKAVSTNARLDIPVALGDIVTKVVDSEILDARLRQRRAILVE